MTSKQLCQDRSECAAWLRLIGRTYRDIALIMKITPDQARRYVAKGTAPMRPSLVMRQTDPAPLGDDSELRDEEREDAKRREEDRREQNERNQIYRG